MFKIEFTRDELNEIMFLLNDHIKKFNVCGDFFDTPNLKKYAENIFALWNLILKKCGNALEGDE